VILVPLWYNPLGLNYSSRTLSVCSIDICSHPKEQKWTEMNHRKMPSCNKEEKYLGRRPLAGMPNVWSLSVGGLLGLALLQGGEEVVVLLFLF
jgi:hypothetical protein